MQTQTKPKAPAPQEAETKGEIAHFKPPRLPWNDAIEKAFGDVGVNKSTWKALVEAIWPNATSVDAVATALAYCRARSLDPFKRVVHIVPMYNSALKKVVEQPLPGIADHRTTASRTKSFAGVDKAEFGPTAEHVFHADAGTDDRGNAVAGANLPLKYPEWCRITVYRIVQSHRVAFVGPIVYWTEYYGRKGRSEIPNDRWAKAPFQMLEKCAEAAALRRAFPEELGDEPVAEEAGVIERQTEVEARPKRATEPAEEPMPAQVEPLTVIDLDHNQHLFNPEQVATAVDVLLGVFTAAEKQGADALEGMWEGNDVFVARVREIKPELADRIQAEYGEVCKRLKPKAEPVSRETAEPEAKAPKPTQQPAPSAAQAAAKAKRAEVLSPFNPKATDKSPGAWERWADWAVAEIGTATPVETEAFAKKHANELTYLRAYEDALYQKVAVALDQKR